jgi:hypothetical protein
MSEDVLLEAGAVRFKPMLLTALAAMISAATILLDPIFRGLAISCCSDLLVDHAHRPGHPGDLIVLRGRPGKAWAAAGKPRWKA